jgi:hypothetical protein
MASQITVSPDLVRMALARPLDWAQFETIVCEVLSQDDFPNLRKMGGVGDEGVDAVDEVYFDDQLHSRTVVQVTSQRAQERKLLSTIARLKEAGKTFNRLVLVYRHPVESGVKKDLEDKAVEQKVLIDIRDEDYLVARLGGPSVGVFTRYFGDLRTQLNFLLRQDDPLGSATDPVRRAMLASLAAFVVNPSAINTRIDFFDQSVLAVLVAHGQPIDIEPLQRDLEAALPGEQIQRAGLLQSIERLETAGQCVLVNGNPTASDSAVATVGSTIAFMTKAVERIREKVVGDVRAKMKIDDASKGRIERNVKICLVRLFRVIGPTNAAAADIYDHLQSKDPIVVTTLSDQLSSEQSHAVISALNAFVRDDHNTELLAKLARSYAAFELRNMDPIGRQFQQEALSRSTMILDTDAILHAAIEELPEHRPLTDSLNALKKDNVRIIVPRQMLEEAVVHIMHADRTYRRVVSHLERLPEESVLAEVWHAVVRGYYYFVPVAEELEG